ncbi:MAG: sensor histidine kinase [Ktedonobacteraceae bacterium]
MDKGGKKRRFYRLINRIPIRWRLVLLSMGLLVLLLSLSSVVISIIAEQSLLANEVNVLQNESHLAMRGIKGRPFAPSDVFLTPGVPSPAFEPTAAELVHRLISPTTNAAILSTDGTVLLPGSTLAFSSLPVTIAPGKVKQTLTTSDLTTSYLLVKDAQGKRQMVVLIPLVSGFHTLGILQISTPTAPIDNFLATLRLILFLGVVGTLCLGAALTFPLLSIALHPLVEIERASRRIAQGALSMRIDPPPTQDEIGRLALSFNRMVAQLEAAFQRQKRFVSDVSHELRTPLTALSGSLEMLLIGADRGDMEASRRLAHGMYAEIQRMHRLVEDLLALTQLDTGKIALRENVVYVDGIIQKVYEQAQHLSNGQQLCYDVAPDLPPVRVDEDRLQQVLLNIVDNALKFTPSSGRVDMQTSSEGQDGVIIQVRDTGQGIAPDALPHVFDRFYRTDSSRSRSPQRAGGSGLGLAIAKELIEAQGGSISIDSTPGEGTTVTLHFLAARLLDQSKRLVKKK